MRRIKRAVLPPATQKALALRQAKADEKRQAGLLNVGTEWDAGRKTVAFRTVLDSLRQMAGRRERCMYCCDSHGCDIEHFWPKSRYSDRMFVWSNLLLCCTECGRFKGDSFPLEDAQPMLVDPSVDDPWRYLDFDPDTGLIVARFDLALGAESPKGVETVRLLQLDRREALNDGYVKTWRRLVAVLDKLLAEALPDVPRVIDALREADDHGLLGWCFSGTGQKLPPFSTLRQRAPAAWQACTQAFT